MRRGALLLAGLLALAGWVWAGDTFEVGGELQGPLMIAAGPMGWSRGCWGVTYERTLVDASWTRCLGAPHGPRRCVGYPPVPPGAPGSLALPLGPLREIPCPALGDHVGGGGPRGRIRIEGSAHSSSR